MRILLLHNYYQHTGGEDVVVQTEAELLRVHGHDVRLLTVDNHGIQDAASRLRAAASAIYSRSSRRLVASEIAGFRPDLVHVHNFFPLWSPAVYDACREARVPVVQTLHNCRLACPSSELFRDRKLCEECVGQRLPWPSVVHGCYRGSRLQSAAVALMVGVHHARGTWSERVDAYVVLTDFQRELLIRAGLPASRLHVKPNFVFDPGPSTHERRADYLLFVGRLAEDKGVSLLIKTYLDHGVRLPLKVVGAGPLHDALKAQVAAAGYDGVIDFLGQQDKPSVLALMRHARFLVMPSLSFEGLPMVMLEAFACGLPVLASKVGPLPQLVSEPGAGWLTPSQPERLSHAIQAAWDDPFRSQYGQAARQAFLDRYAPEANYAELMAIYRRAQDSLAMRAGLQPPSAPVPCD